MQSVKSQIQIIFFIVLTFMFSYEKAYARLTDGQVEIKINKKINKKMCKNMLYK